MPEQVSIPINNCKRCPHCKKQLSKSHGYATDYRCLANKKKLIARYIEWPSEEPQDGAIPEWCPFTNDNIS